MKTIILKKGKESSLTRKHRWVFSGAIAKSTAEVDNGELVSVEDATGNYIGVGHYHNGSIAVRMLTFEKERIDQTFWNKRFQEAFSVRKGLGLPSKQTDCFRLIHAEGDGLPGCVVDVYANCAVIQSHTDGMASQVKEIATALENINGFCCKRLMSMSSNRIAVVACYRAKISSNADSTKTWKRNKLIYAQKTVSSTRQRL